MFPLALTTVIFAGRALATYNGHKIVTTLLNGEPAWPEMVMADHNGLLGTACFALFISGIGPVMFPVEIFVLFLTYSLYFPYLWGHDAFNPGYSLRTRL